MLSHIAYRVSHTNCLLLLHPSISHCFNDFFCSGQVANLTPFFSEPLHVAMQIRLYLQPFWLDGASTRLSVLPFGIVVARSSFEASLRIVFVRCSLNSPSYVLRIPTQRVHGYCQTRMLTQLFHAYSEQSKTQKHCQKQRPDLQFLLVPNQNQ